MDLLMELTQMQKRHPSPRASSIRTLFSQIFPRNAPHLNSHPLFEPAGPHRQYLGCSSPHKLQRFLCLIDIELSVVCLGLLELDGHSSLFGTSRELTFHATMNISANFTPMKTLLNSDNWNPSLRVMWERRWHQAQLAHYRSESLL
jgi:hypothetical protein